MERAASLGAIILAKHPVLDWRCGQKWKSVFCMWMKLWSWFFLTGFSQGPNLVRATVDHCGPKANEEHVQAGRNGRA